MFYGTTDNIIEGKVDRKQRRERLWRSYVSQINEKIGDMSYEQVIKATLGMSQCEAAVEPRQVMSFLKRNYDRYIFDGSSFLLNPNITQNIIPWWRWKRCIFNGVHHPCIITTISILAITQQVHTYYPDIKQ